MKYLHNIPICANTLFLYELDIKDDLTLKFTEEKFKSTSSPTLITEKSNQCHA